MSQFKLWFVPFFLGGNAEFLCIVKIFGDSSLGLINVVPWMMQRKDVLWWSLCIVSLLGLGFINEQFHAFKCEPKPISKQSILFFHFAYVGFLKKIKPTQVCALEWAGPLP